MLSETDMVQNMLKCWCRQWLRLRLKRLSKHVRSWIEVVNDWHCSKRFLRVMLDTVQNMLKCWCCQWLKLWWEHAQVLMLSITETVLKTCSRVDVVNDLKLLWKHVPESWWSQWLESSLKTCSRVDGVNDWNGPYNMFIACSKEWDLRTRSDYWQLAPHDDGPAAV